MSPLLVLFACAKSVETGASTSPTPSETGTPLMPADRGPTTVPVDGDPNGLWWDGERLLIADDNNNRVLSWTDAEGLGAVGTLAAAPPDGPGLGQLVVTGDGTIVVTRFGFGTAGDVVTLSPDGASTVVPNLDVERRRIGLTVTEDGTLFDTWFISTDVKVGAVSRLDLAGTETEVMSGLEKPVGVLVVGDTLVVTDQDLGQVLTAPLADPSDVSVLALVEEPDLLCAGPDGSVFTGGPAGEVRHVSASGALSTFVSGYQEVRGCAYDAANGRLFFVDHDGDESDGTTHFLQIVPVGP